MLYNTFFQQVARTLARIVTAAIAQPKVTTLMTISLSRLPAIRTFAAVVKIVVLYTAVEFCFADGVDGVDVEVAVVEVVGGGIVGKKVCMILEGSFKIKVPLTR